MDSRDSPLEQGDLQSLVSQLNVLTPQIELTLQELRGAQLVMSGQVQRLIESAEMELMNVIVSFRAELDTRAAVKAQSDKMLKQDMQRLMMQVHQKFVEVDAAVATILVNIDGKRSNRFSACAAGRSTVRATNHSKCNGAAGAVSVGCRDTPATRFIARDHVTQIQCGSKTLDRPQEAGFGREA